MARVCGVKLLLLSSAFFYIANCQTTTVATVPSVARPTLNAADIVTPAPGARNAVTTVPTVARPTLNAADIVTPAPAARNADANVSTDDLSTHNATNITTPAPDVAIVQCSFTVEPVDYGFEFNFTGSDKSMFVITSKVRGESEVTTYRPGVNQLESLKPCTEYELKVYDTRDLGTPCNCSVNTSRTIGMAEEQVTFNQTCSNWDECFQTGWNITNMMSKPGFNDICTDLAIHFPSTHCNSTFSVTNYIGVEFLKNTTVQTQRLSKYPWINATLPEKCTNLTQEWVCQGQGDSGHMSLSQLEPFTNYTCNGTIENNMGFTHNLTGIKLNIDCDLKLDVANKTDNTSVRLTWKTNSQNCKEMLRKFTYNCSCQPCNKSQTVYTKTRECDFHHLTPYTKYSFAIQPFYNHTVLKRKEKVFKVTTGAGVPESVTNVSLTFTKHNKLEVTCKNPSKVYGPKTITIANLSYGSTVLYHYEKTCKDGFTFDGLDYSTTYELKLYVFNGKNNGHVWRKEITTSYNDKAIIGVLIFFIILILLALLFVSYKIYLLKRTKSRDLSENICLIPSANEEEKLRLIDPIPAEMLLETYKLKAADEARLFLAEFQSIPRIFSRYSIKEAKKNANVPKNRYIDILPYDYNRVQLTTGNGETGCDYINASFIDGFKESKKYIAAQGPKEETVGDFWRMIWEQKSTIIVMVTRCEENKRPKCQHYWPSPDHDVETYQEFEVKLKSEDFCPNYIIRHLSLMNKKEKSSEREVTHIQFISWPDHGVPSEAHLLLKLRRQVNAFKNLFSGPIVVHCSAGVGRTGTYISIDAMMESIEAEGEVDIFGYVVMLRKQRCLMVQVEGQYTLIHQALLEHTLFGDTEISLADLHSAVTSLKQKSSDSEPTLMEDEFERLANYKNWRTTNSGMTEENKKKNRSTAVTPYDYNRVVVKPDQGVINNTEPDDKDYEDSSLEEEDDEQPARYINASYVNGYWGLHSFITAQTPMPETIADFWLMVYQNNASMVVMFSDSSEDGKDFIYWDTDNKAYGDIEVEMTSTKTYPTFVIRSAMIRHVKRKESRPIKHVQFLNWKSGELPESPHVLTDFMKEVRSSSVVSNSLSTFPIVVHCNDGSSRSGIFCALWNLLDSAETEKLVDVFQVSKALCKERQGLISSLNQYQFLYDALEVLYPVQNGDVKADPESDLVQIVDETKAAERPPSATVESEESKVKAQEASEPVSSSPTETSLLDQTGNSTMVTVEL